MSVRAPDVVADELIEELGIGGVGDARTIAAAIRADRLEVLDAAIRIAEDGARIITRLRDLRREVEEG